MNIYDPEVTAAGCVPQETTIEGVKLAHAYVPFQKLCDTFTPEGALMKGTAFPPLVNVYGWRPKDKGDTTGE